MMITNIKKNIRFSLCYNTWTIEMMITINLFCPVSWGCGIHWLLFCRGVRPTPNECPGYDTKLSDGEVPVMLELWGMWSILSFPLLPGRLWPGVVAPDRVLFRGQIELNCVLILNRIPWNRTVFDIETACLC